MLFTSQLLEGESKRFRNQTLKNMSFVFHFEPIQCNLTISRKHSLQMLKKKKVVKSFFKNCFLAFWLWFFLDRDSGEESECTQWCPDELSLGSVAYGMCTHAPTNYSFKANIKTNKQSSYFVCLVGLLSILLLLEGDLYTSKFFGFFFFLVHTSKEDIVWNNWT